MNSRIELFASRSSIEEGDRRRPYNDATGKTVTCRPEGNLSIGRGINLEVGLDDEEEDWLFYHRAGKTDLLLSKQPWYPLLDEVVGSVILDIAYNNGVEGFLNGFPRMIAALKRGDIAGVAEECCVKNEGLDKQRYEPLRRLLLTRVST